MLVKFELFFIVLILIVFTTQAVVYKKWKYRKCDIENLDICGRVVFLYGNRDILMPNNTQEMIPHCEEEKSAVKCVFDWSKKCLKPFQRQSLNLLMNGAAKSIKERCNKKGTEWYLKNNQCVINSAESQHRCMESLNQDIDSITRNPNKKEWLSSVCCFVDKWQQCFHNGAKPHCDEDGIKFLEWGADAYVSELTDMACNGKYQYKSSKCSMLDNIPPLPMNSTTKIPKSILVTMFNLLEKFSDTKKKV